MIFESGVARTDARMTVRYSKRPGRAALSTMKEVMTKVEVAKESVEYSHTEVANELDDAGTGGRGAGSRSSGNEGALRNGCNRRMLRLNLAAV